MLRHALIFIIPIFILAILGCPSQDESTNPSDSRVTEPEPVLDDTGSEEAPEDIPAEINPPGNQMSNADTLMNLIQANDIEGVQGLLEEIQGADIDQINSQGLTALMTAVNFGRTEIVRELLDAGADPNKANQDGFTPLMFATGNGDIDAYNLLVESGADREIASSNGTTVLMSAAMGGNIDIYRDLVDAGLDRSAVTTDGANTLIYSVIGGNFEIYNDLIEIVDDPNYADNAGFTALMGACMGGEPAIVEDLLDRGADPDVKTSDNLSALRFAVMYQHGDAVDLLIEQGVDPDEIGLAGQNPILVDAADNANSLMVSKLIDAGADIEVANNKGYTPLMFAALAGDLELVNELIDSGADVNAANSNGNTVLMEAILGRNPDVVRDIIEAGADMTARNGVGFDPLLLSTSMYSRGSEEEVRESADEFTRVTQVVLDASPDINVTTPEGMTPLAHAAAVGNQSTVKLLLDAGADPNIAGTNADTPLNTALLSEKVDLEIIKDLIDGGSDVSITSNLTGMSPLRLAVMRPDLGAEVVSMILDAGADMYEMGPQGYSAFLWALSVYGDTEVIMKFIDAGIDLNHDYNGKKALDYVVDNDELRELLISHGAEE